jgi:hypothetical protein
MNSKQSILAATLGTIALVAAFNVVSGGAATASPTQSGSPSASTESCWIDVSTQESLCVPAGEDLIAAVKDDAGVSISVPSGTTVGGIAVTPARNAAALLVPAAAATTTTVSAIYDDINYGGGTLLLTANAAGCSWYVTSLGAYGWNDRASSFKSFAGCKTGLWQNDGFSGTHVGYTTNLASFGSFNDQASSWATE